MRICVHIVVDNIMTRVFKSTVLNCKYFGGFCMNLFQTRIYCTKFSVEETIQTIPDFAVGKRENLFLHR